MLEQHQILSSLQKYKNKYKNKYGIEDIGIFGSYAKNSAHNDSDLDIFVRLTHSNLFTLSRMRIELEEIFGIHTDIVQIRDKMNNYLKKHIEEEAISA